MFREKQNFLNNAVLILNLRGPRSKSAGYFSYFTIINYAHTMWTSFGAKKLNILIINELRQPCVENFLNNNVNYNVEFKRYQVKYPENFNY